MKREIASLYPHVGLDVWDMVDAWRNDLIHGKEYWQNTVPVLANLICLLIIDEIDAAFYNSQTNNIKTKIQWTSKIWENTGIRAPWDLFPPDI
jgi:hypothetical protein